MKPFREDLDGLIAQLDTSEPMTLVKYVNHSFVKGWVNFEPVPISTLEPRSVRALSRGLLEEMAHDGEYDPGDEKKLRKSLGYSYFKMRWLEYAHRPRAVLAEIGNKFGKPILKISAAIALGYALGVGAYYVGRWINPVHSNIQHSNLSHSSPSLQTEGE